MKARRSWLPLSLAALVASCGSPAAPTEVPDFRGSWGSVFPWRWTASPTNAPDNQGSFSSTGCDGVIEITSQNGSAFAGTYRIDCLSSGRSSGAVLDGQLGPNSGISFRLSATEGFDPGVLPGSVTPPCVPGTDSGTYMGSVVGGAISVRRLQTLQCLTGGVQVTAAFSGVRN